MSSQNNWRKSFNPRAITQTGLLALVNRRKKLLAYLARENYERYVSLCAELGIRRK